MLFGRHQDMPWEQRINVEECEGLAILIDAVGGNQALNNLAKSAGRVDVGHHFSGIEATLAAGTANSGNGFGSQ